MIAVVTLVSLETRQWVKMQSLILPGLHRIVSGSGHCQHHTDSRGGWGLVLRPVSASPDYF